jgi:hypothetical protein
MPIDSAAVSSSRTGAEREPLPAYTSRASTAIDQRHAEDARQALEAQVDRGVRGRRERESARAAHRVDVQDRDADDLARAERRDRQVVAAQAQRWNRDHDPRDRGDEPPQHEHQREVHDARERERHALRHRVEQRSACEHRERGRRVRADRHEARVPDRELSGEAVHELQGDRGDHRDADARQDRHVVRIQNERRSQIEQSQKTEHRADREQRAHAHAG